MSSLQNLYIRIVLVPILSLSSSGACAQAQTQNDLPPQAAIASESQSNSVQQERIQKLSKAISSFKSMGVGVSPFEHVLSQAQSLLEQGKTPECAITLDQLNSALEDQQKSFYSNKMRVWRTQRKKLIAAARKNEGSYSAGSVEPAGGMSKAATGVLTRGKGDYKPLIYPIAR